jgi:fatty acid synthase subunit beta
MAAAVGIGEASASTLVPEEDWVAQFAPRLARVEITGQIVIDNKWSRFFGTSPVMQAGMTPTSSLNGVDFVAAICNAGFWGELGGGGLPRASIFREKIDALCAKLRPGVGFILNLLYLNAKQWAFQFPLALEMRRQGYPIESITIAAGVPTPGKAESFIDEMLLAGMKYVSFKPGSVSSIRDVVSIAAAHPAMTVVLQWTGGRGGGHHSFEDMHQPLLQEYGNIRCQQNIILVAGSGLGDAKGSFPYMDGSWAMKYGRPCMPFDGILVASRLMAAKEASTSPAIKSMLAATPGVQNEDDWEGTYTGGAGGVITVLSELGEPIHNILNRATRLWSAWDKKFFAVPRDEREQVILAHKDEIIAGLNRDFQKVFFGQRRVSRTSSSGFHDDSEKQGGFQPCDVWEMTYSEVAERMCELMYVGDQGARPHRWIDVTFQSRVVNWLLRVQDRFPQPNSGTSEERVSMRSIEKDPETFLRGFFDVYVAAQSHVLMSEDVDFFMHMCKFGGKPVPFVPIIDGELSVWFKKDSLWYSEDLDAVPDQDAERVIILQGPVSVKHIKKVDEPVAEILNGISKGWIAELQKRSGGVTPRVVSSIVASTRASVTESKISNYVSRGGVIIKPAGTGEMLYSVTSEAVVTQEGWFACVSSGGLHGDVCVQHGDIDWLEAALCPKVIVDVNAKWVKNPLQRVFRSGPNRTIRVLRDGGNGECLSASLLDERMQDVCTIKPSASAADAAGKHIQRLDLFMHYYESSSDKVQRQHTLVFKFGIDWSVPRMRTFRIREGENDRIKEFYAGLWGDADEASDNLAASLETTRTVRFELTEERAAAMIAATSSRVPVSSIKKETKTSASASMDAAILVAWQPLVQALLPSALDASILELLHLNNSYRWVTGSGDTPRHLRRSPMKIGSTLVSSGSISEIVKTPSGLAVTVKATISEERSAYSPTLEVQSTFLFRSSFLNKPDEEKAITFRHRNVNKTYNFCSDATKILKEKTWFRGRKVDDEQRGFVSGRLTFDFRVAERGLDVGSIRESKVSGTVAAGSIIVGDIDFSGRNLSGNENAVQAFLNRACKSKDIDVSEATTTNFFDHGGYNILEEPVMVVAPSDTTDYAYASTDLNPIHRCNNFAAMAGLQKGVIVHGMWTFAAARQIVQKHLARGNQARIRSFSASFEGMVFPEDRLYTQLKHIGVSDEAMVFDIVVSNERGSTVLRGRSEVEMEQSVYVFTGQGSASVGMGMDLFEKSSVSSSLWRRADSHLLKTFGFSILDIVRKNPKELTIHFGGRLGQAVRSNYLKMMCVDPVTKENVPLIPEITPRTDNFSFRFPEGLLFATQFTQPALVLMELASFFDMQANGLVGSDFLFAGHSLGEYAALSAANTILPVESVVELVFLRGLTMQRAVSRDSQGRSDFGMVAASTTRIGRWFTEEALHQLVDAIADNSGKLLQVVNYNIEGFQYVVAGHIVCLEVLEKVCTALFF